jgi:hypothetical protein
MDLTSSSGNGGRGAAEEAQLVSVSEHDGTTRDTYAFPERAPRLNVEHDPEKRLFRVAQSDGTTAFFRDEPVRFLVVARNPQTGDVMPVMRYGEPEYLYLCREERERG